MSVIIVFVGQMLLGLLYTVDTGGTVLIWRLDSFECIATINTAVGRIERMALGFGMVYCYGAHQRKAYLELLFDVRSFRR